jgi:hypothetical protein
MGAFTAVEADNRTHYSQGYIPKQEPNYQPYKQDFLALVPSNPDSYQTYSVDITPSVLPKMTSGQHVYFLSQPRFLGLEYATGQEHLLLRKQGSTDGKDSFRN